MNPDALADIPAIRHAFPDVPASTIRWWAHCGFLDQRGRDGRRRLYRVGDVVALRAGACRLTDRPFVANTSSDRRRVSAA